MASTVNNNIQSFETKFLKSEQFKTMDKKYPLANLNELATSIIRNLPADQTPSQTEVLKLLKLKRDKYLELLNQYVDGLSQLNVEDSREKKLFAIYLGGRIKGCTTEIHDIAFVAGTKVEDTYPELVKKWIGNKDNVHIDSILELSELDGYQITLKPTQQTDSDSKLYFLNYGGYNKGCFGEFHRYGFAIGKNSSEAMAKVSKKFAEIYKSNDIEGKHLDDNLPIESAGVDDCLNVEKIKSASCYVHIEQAKDRIDDSSNAPAFKVLNDYRPLNMWKYQPVVEGRDAQQTAQAAVINTQWQNSLKMLKTSNAPKQIAQIKLAPPQTIVGRIMGMIKLPTF